MEDKNAYANAIQDMTHYLQVMGAYQRNKEMK
jgi:hypothetical protein